MAARRLPPLAGPAAAAAIVAAALGLRLWGIHGGLPYTYNVDERAHYVPRAVALVGHSWLVHWLVNPPGYTYLLRLVLGVRFHAAPGVAGAFANHPATVYETGRLLAAVLGALSVWLVYLAGARLFGRAAGLVAAAVLAVAFLPVFYAHLALDDAPALAPLALSQVGSAGLLRGGRPRDGAIAGAGLGLAAATKYTAGVAALPLLVAAAVALARSGPSGRRRAGLAVGAALLAGVAGFALANPSAVVHPHDLLAQLSHERAYTGRGLLLGQTDSNGVHFYGWSLLWGLGWAPLAAAALGAAWLALRDRPAALLLIPAPVLLLLYLGLQGRYFGRWLLPAYPFLCLLAGVAVAQLAALVGQRRARLGVLAGVLAGAALCAQGALASVHDDRVLSRPDTRALARTWMVAHVPARSRVVIEPIVPATWLTDSGRLVGPFSRRARWRRFGRDSATRHALAREFRGAIRAADFQNYEGTLFPGLVRLYERDRFCWVVTGSTQWGRARADPRRVPQAIAYYRALRRAGRVVYHVSPFARGARPVPFNFDWSFDYEPRAYVRAGPEVTIYRLRGGACAPSRPRAGRLA